MIKLLLSSGLSVLLALPAPALAVTISPLNITTTSSAPARAVASSSIAARSAAASSVAQEAQVDMYIKIPDIDGESENKGIEPDEIDVMSDPEEGIEPDEIDVMQDPEEAQVDVFIKIPDIEGESDAQEERTPEDSVRAPSSAAPKKGGNVEYEWKVEEGESNRVPGVEPDEIDVAADVEPNATNFGVLLGGGNDEEEDDEESLTPVEELLLVGLQEEGAPAETLSLNYEKIKVKLKQSVKLLGFIPVDTTATVDVDAQGQTTVSFPWWTFLASGKDGDTLGQRVATSLSNVLKAKHDIMMNAVRNMR